MSFNGASTEAHVVYALLMIVCLVSFALSLVVVVAIGLPLVREPKKRTPAASFNLYIVLLSLVDAVGMAWGVAYSVVFYCVQWEGTESPGEIAFAIVDQHLPWWISVIATTFCPPVLLWTVPLVGREILELLRNSKQRKRCKPPALRRVALHGTVACAAGIAAYVFRVLSFVSSGILSYTVSRNIWLGLPIYVIMLVPSLWSLWIVFRIFREGLMRFGAGVGNRLRVLVVYFGRIFLVYCVVLTCMLLIAILSLFEVAGMDFGVVINAGGLILGIQGWVNFAVIRTKPDVGKMIGDLVAGTSCRSGGSNQTGSSGHATGSEPTGRQTEQTTTTQTEDGGAEDDEAEGRERIGNNGGVRLSVYELVSSEFIKGIEDYLSGDEDDEGVVNDGNAGAGGTAVVADTDEEAI